MRINTHTFLSGLSPAGIGIGFAWLGVLIYASSNSIATLLVDIGAAHLVAGNRNAVTFSNLLLAGSVISLFPMCALFRRDWTRANLRCLTRRDWGLLSVSAFVSSALTPGLFFFALENSSVTNIVLISRIEPPLFVIAAAVFLKERLDPRAFSAGLIALCGAMLMTGLSDTGAGGLFGVGEFAAMGATLSYVASTILARRALRNIPMGILMIFRTAAGIVFYFLLISALQGPQQFQDILAPVLWTWIWIYAGIVLVIGQLVWFIALKHARSGDIALASSFSPLAGIVFAMLILGEDPGQGLLPGGALLLLAIYVGQMKLPVLRRRSATGTALRQPSCQSGS